jgi:hypothetical protein
VAEDMDKRWSLLKAVMNIRVQYNERTFLTTFSRRNVVCGVIFLNIQDKLLKLLKMCVFLMYVRLFGELKVKVHLATMSYISQFISYIKPLGTKCRLLYVKTQFVPCSKYFSSRL